MEQYSAAIASLPINGVRYFERTGSTMDDAAAWMRSGAPDLALVIADEQTAGRGRLRRRWFTPPQSALAFSLVLRMAGTETVGSVMRVTGLGGLAVSQGLEELYQLHPQIKWPNDVLLEGRKVAGILAEAHWLGDQLEGIILGIGVNVSPASVPPSAEVQFPATCVADCLPGTSDAPILLDRYRLLAAILQGIVDQRSQIRSVDFIDSWESHLAYRNQSVSVYKDLQQHSADQNDTLIKKGLLAEGKLIGLDSDGALVLQSVRGERLRMEYGELSLRLSSEEVTTGLDLEEK